VRGTGVPPGGGETQRIERQIAGDRGAILRLALRTVDKGRAAKQHFDPGHELAHRERFAQVVVGADLEAEHSVELLLARGDEDDRQRF
jgi:hypothetical protein